MRYFLALFLLFSPLAWAADGRDPKWQEYVVGELSDLPSGPVKKFLETSHHNNAHAADLRSLTRVLGPFSPDEHKVFWIPTIDVPLTPDNWRFLSQLDDLPDGVRENAIVREAGDTKIRMFLHPFTTEQPAFRKMAKRFGGFRFEHQGVTTASTRSFIAWPTERPKPEDGAGKLQFPRNRDRLFWPKVSIFSLDVEGSRLNPLKKMTRAATVTRALGGVPEATRKKVGFDFAGEWVVGVPDGTDAGFVVREVLPEYLGRRGASHVEPAFSVLSPDRLTGYTRGLRHPDQWVEKHVMDPVARVFSYLLMEEGMIGEYHTQNMSFPIGKNGKPTGQVLLHDADAFRTSVVLRAINGKSMEPFRGIDSPFFYMKDSVFRKGGPIDVENMNLNTLLYGYLSDPNDVTTLTGAVYRWCKEIEKYRSWCQKPLIWEMFTRRLADHLSPYLGRPVSLEELSYDGSNENIAKLFRERMSRLVERSPYVQGKPDARIQKVLAREYSRLHGIGLAQDLGDVAGDTHFLLHTKGESAFITAVNPEAKQQLRGVALLGDASDKHAVAFAREIRRLTGRRVPLLEERLVKGLPNQPIYDRKNLGGGNNRVHVRKDCPAQFAGLIP